MTTWQRFAATLATSKRARRMIEPVAARTVLGRRFIEYGSAESAVAAAGNLRERLGIAASLFYLGEYVDDPLRVEETVGESCRVAEALTAAGLDTHVSVDPTAIGYLTSRDLCRENACRVAGVVAAGTGRRCLMLDMEDLNLLEPTIHLFHDLRGLGLPAGITLQARLRRTASDLLPIVETDTTVRLVKGAFPLGPEHDFQGRRAIGRNFLALAEIMLRPQAKEAGFYPAFGTHDDAIAREVIALAHAKGWRPDEYEFEFLYQVRPEWQRELRRQGHAVRVYLPFGTDWWPYVMRRIGENPRNLLLVTRILRQRRAQSLG
jgi:proline dehydrogenase